MGKAKKTRQFAAVKRMISPKDARITKKTNTSNPNPQGSNGKVIDLNKKLGSEAAAEAAKQLRELPQASSALFFKYNTQLGPPYRVLIDTNFINFSIQNKLEIIPAMMDCLFAKCIPCVTDCVMAELEKLGAKYKLALKVAKDPRFERLPCTHKGTYADDCLVQRITQHKCYIVATCDRDLKRRIRKVPGVPIMYIAQHRFTIERMPDAYGAPR